MFEEIKKLFAIDGKCGFSEKEVAKACEKYGALPEMLQQYYLQLGKHTQLNYSQNSLCGPDKLIDAGEYVIFYKENQYVAQWALKKSDLCRENPPVYCSLDEHHFELECETLYDFLCAMANFQAASWGLLYGSEEIYALEEDQLIEIQKRYKKKPYELHIWIEICFYGNHDEETICVMEEDQMLFASCIQEHVEAIEAVVEELGIEAL